MTQFDDYTSDWFELDNGIGQGDPLSMLLYLFYNADLLDLAKGPDEKSLSYVDDIAFMATANNFTQTHRVLKSMMLRAWGGLPMVRSTQLQVRNLKVGAYGLLLIQIRCPPPPLHPGHDHHPSKLPQVYWGHAGPGAPVGATG